MLPMSQFDKTVINIGYHYQVIPGHVNPQKGGQRLAVIYSNIFGLNTRLFARYVRRHPSKRINTKELPENLFRCLRQP